MTYGEIPMSGDNVFRWMMTGTTTPEVCGWIEKNHTILKGSYGFWRTDDPQEAARRASISFNIPLEA